MDKLRLVDFLISARSKTYAGDSGKVTPSFTGSHQLEYKEKDWFYRDVYNLGNRLFMGLETVYFQNKPVWSMSYYGNFQEMTEQEVDNILRKALTDKRDKARLWNNVEQKIHNYKYICNGSGHIDELSGTEKIFKDGKNLYFFYYAGGFIGK